MAPLPDLGWTQGGAGEDGDAFSFQADLVGKTVREPRNELGKEDTESRGEGMRGGGSEPAEERGCGGRKESRRQETETVILFADQ